jgi:hypothetical protein
VTLQKGFEDIVPLLLATEGQTISYKDDQGEEKRAVVKWGDAGIQSGNNETIVSSGKKLANRWTQITRVYKARISKQEQETGKGDEDNDLQLSEKVSLGHVFPAAWFFLYLFVSIPMPAACPLTGIPYIALPGRHPTTTLPYDYP